MVTYGLTSQSVTSSASASGSDLLQHFRLLLTEPTSVNSPPVALQKPNPSLDAAEQRSGLDNRDQKSRFREHPFGQRTERSERMEMCSSKE